MRKSEFRPNLKKRVDMIVVGDYFQMRINTSLVLQQRVRSVAGLFVWDQLKINFRGNVYDNE